MIKYRIALVCVSLSKLLALLCLLESFEDTHLLLTVLSPDSHLLVPIPPAAPAWDLDDLCSRPCLTINFLYINFLYINFLHINFLYINFLSGGLVPLPPVCQLAICRERE